MTSPLSKQEQNALDKKGENLHPPMERGWLLSEKMDHMDSEESFSTRIEKYVASRTGIVLHFLFSFSFHFVLFQSCNQKHDICEAYRQFFMIFRNIF